MIAPVIPAEEIQALLAKVAKTKRLDFRWLKEEEIDGFRALFEYLYNSEHLSTTEIAKMVGKSQLFAWSMCRRLGINLRSREDGGRLYAPKRTPNARRPFDGSSLDRAYLKGFSHGDLDVRRVSNLAIMVSSTTTHPSFAVLFESLFRSYGPVYIYPMYDRVSGYRWKVAARLDNSFAFMLPEQRIPYPDYSSKDEFFAWLAGLVDADGSVGIIHAGSYVRVNLEIANEDIGLLRHIREQLLRAGYAPSGPYMGHPKGHVTRGWNIRYNEDMFYLLLQRSEEVKDILRRLGLRHPEKEVRKEFVFRLPRPMLWRSVRAEVEGLRRGVEVEVQGYIRFAGESYNKRRHKRWRESPTLRLSRALRPRRTN